MKVQFNCRIEESVAQWIMMEAGRRTVETGKRVSQGEVIEMLVAERGKVPEVFVNRAQMEPGITIPLKPRKQSKKEKVVEVLKASDPMAGERDDVDYGAHEELPSGGSVAVVGAAVPVKKSESSGEMKPHSFCSGIHPIAGCGNCAKMAREFQKSGEKKK